MTHRTERKLLFFIDRIEDSSYPVTETGYALVYRAWLRSLVEGGEVYVAYPDCTWAETPDGELRVLAHKIVSFADAPYHFYRSQREQYCADNDVGSRRCHSESEGSPLLVNGVDAAVWRQESGAPEQARALLQALERVERDTIIYLSPRLALDPRFGSKTIPGHFDPRVTPRSYHTDERDGFTAYSARDKALRALAFVRAELGTPETVIAKPLYGNNGVGIHTLGLDPVSGQRTCDVDDLGTWLTLIERYGDLVVQEYVPSVRSPVGQSAAALGSVPHDRYDFGEVRFLLIDGEIPRNSEGRPCLIARRVPTDTSLIADSGISYATTLSPAELAFLERLGPFYRRLGIYFGGGDLIRTPDPARPFVFTDAARSVCGHAVVTGALNGAPYLIIDHILDSVERHIEQATRRIRTLPPQAAHGTPA